MAKQLRNRKDPLVCLCNQVPQSQIVEAMLRGACSLAQIFDATFAGCGPCGGSCQPQLVAMLEAHQRRLDLEGEG